MGNNPTVPSLKAWASRTLAKHVCLCDDCRSARAVLESIMRAEAAKLLPDRLQPKRRVV